MMSKRTFLNQLAGYLKQLPKDDYQEVLAYFEELFDDAGAEGEADLMASLGTPKEAAEEILQYFTELAETQRGEAVSSEAATERSTYSTEFTNQALPAFDSISLKLDRDDVFILASPDGSFGISHPNLNSDKDPSFYYRVKDGVLEIESRSQKDDSPLGLRFRNFLNKHLQVANNLVLSIPQGTPIQSLIVNLGYGDLTLTGVTVLDGAVTLGYGELDLQSTTISDVTFNTGYGDVTLENSQLFQSSFNTGYGDIEMVNCQTRTVTANTAYGDVTASHSDVRFSHFATSSGDFEWSDGMVQQTDLSTHSGDISLIRMTYEGDIKTGTSYGDVEINCLANVYDRLSVTAETDFGEIEVAFGNGEDRAVEGSYSHTAINPLVTLTAITSSGDISLS